MFCGCIAKPKQCGNTNQGDAAPLNAAKKLVHGVADCKYDPRLHHFVVWLNADNPFQDLYLQLEGIEAWEKKSEQYWHEVTWYAKAVICCEKMQDFCESTFCVATKCLMGTKQET